MSASVVARHLFYKDSPRYDATGNPRAPLPFSHDNAIATDKSAYMPGTGTATFANVSNYTRGINGIMVDIAGRHGTITANDFAFKVGNNNTPASWSTEVPTPTVTVRRGAGVGGSDRVELTWTDNAIQRTWLMVIVKGNDRLGGYDTNTDLAKSDVFFFANALAHSGNLPGDATTFTTTVNDEVEARNHPKALFANIPITDIYDYNRDGKVDASDQLAARNSLTSDLTAPKHINIAVAGPFTHDP